MSPEIEEIMERVERTGILFPEDKEKLLVAFNEQWEKVKPLAMWLQAFKRHLGFGFFPALPSPMEDMADE